MMNFFIIYYLLLYVCGCESYSILKQLQGSYNLQIIVALLLERKFRLYL